MNFVPLPGAAQWPQQLLEWPSSPPQGGQQLQPPCRELRVLKEQVRQQLDGYAAVLSASSRLCLRSAAHTSPTRRHRTAECCCRGSRVVRTGVRASLAARRGSGCCGRTCRWMSRRASSVTVWAAVAEVGSPSARSLTSSPMWPGTQCSHSLVPVGTLLHLLTHAPLQGDCGMLSRMCSRAPWESHSRAQCLRAGSISSSKSRPRLTPTSSAVAEDTA